METTVMNITDKRKYRCPKHGIVTKDNPFLGNAIDRSPHIAVTIVSPPRYYCLACYADWLEANIPQLNEVEPNAAVKRAP